jgi:hypothetical protein
LWQQVIAGHSSAGQNRSENIMPRPLRNEFARAAYDVMARGNQASQAVSRLQRKPGRKSERLKRLLLEAEVECG